VQLSVHEIEMLKEMYNLIFTTNSALSHPVTSSHNNP
jgi:hypothetical protein